jgi:hypothetical protein
MLLLLVIVLLACWEISESNSQRIANAIRRAGMTPAERAAEDRADRRLTLIALAAILGLVIVVAVFH